MEFLTTVVLIAIGTVLGVAWQRHRSRVRTPAPLPVVIVRERAPLEIEQRNAIFQSWGATDERWQAVEDVILENLESVQIQASHIALAESHGPLAHMAGGVEWLRYLHQQLRHAISGDTKQRPKGS